MIGIFPGTVSFELSNSGVSGEGRPGGSVGQVSTFGSGQDLTVYGFEPQVGLCANGKGPGRDSLSLSLSLCPSPIRTFPLSLSLSQDKQLLYINKLINYSGIRLFTPHLRQMGLSSRREGAHLTLMSFSGLLEF